MFRLRLALAAFAVVFCVSGEEVPTPNSGSGGDQYGNRKETAVFGHPPLEMALSLGEEATDRTRQLDQKGLLMRLSSQKDRPTTKKKSVMRKKRATKPNPKRLKRSYQPYNPGYQMQWPQFEGLNTWRTSFYPIQRPYFVPVYGYDGRIPLYYPPCTYYHNPGTPPHNPNKPPYVAPTYLPPVTTSAPPDKNDTTMMPVDNRFGDNDDDERPIWDNNGSYYPNRPTTSRSVITPTRKPASATSTVPPLVHKEGEASGRPSPESNIDKEGTEVPAAIPRPEGPSKCVWAIVSCCSTSSRDISYECFDQLGCGGPFWDVNPCDTEYAKAAIQTALNYYNSRF